MYIVWYDTCKSLWSQTIDTFVCNIVAFILQNEDQFSRKKENYSKIYKYFVNVNVKQQNIVSRVWYKNEHNFKVKITFQNKIQALKFMRQQAPNMCQMRRVWSAL